MVLVEHNYDCTVCRYGVVLCRWIGILWDRSLTCSCFYTFSLEQWSCLYAIIHRICYRCYSFSKWISRQNKKHKLYTHPIQILKTKANKMNKLNSKSKWEKKIEINIKWCTAAARQTRTFSTYKLWYTLVLPYIPKPHDYISEYYSNTKSESLKYNSCGIIVKSIFNCPPKSYSKYKCCP